MIPIETRFPFFCSDRFFFVVFFHVFLVLFFRLLSVASWAPSRRLLGPTSSVSEANLAPKTKPKSRFLDVQEGTYLKRAENVKIVATPIRKHDFWGPGASQNRSKIDGKSILRAFYVEVLFQYPLETLPEPSWARLGRDLWNFGAQVGSQVGAKLGLGGAKFGT